MRRSAIEFGERCRTWRGGRRFLLPEVDWFAPVPHVIPTRQRAFGFPSQGTITQHMHICKPKPQRPVSAFLITLSATAIGVVPLSGQTADTTRRKVSIGQVASFLFGAAAT